MARYDDNTSDFDTTEMSGDGRFFGIKISPDLAGKLNIARGTMMSWLSDKVERYATPAAKKLGESKFGESVLRIKNPTRFASKAASTAAYATILSHEISSVGINVYDSMKSMNELRRSVSPLVQAGNASAAPLSGDNEVVANARKKINSVFWQRLMKTGTDAITVMPSLWIKVTKQTERNRERETTDALEAAKGDPKKVADILDKKVQASVVQGVTEVELQSGINELIARREATYKADFAKFEKEEGVKIEAALKDALNITKDNYREKAKELRSLGIDADNWFAKKWDHELQRSVPPRDAKLDEAINDLKQELGDPASLKHYTEAAVKSRFVQKFGAFDDEWAEYQRSGNRSKTIRDELEDKIDTLENKKNEAKNNRGDDGEKNTEMAEAAAGLGAGLLSEVSAKALFGGDKNKYQKPVALDRILQLRRELDKAGDSALEQVQDKYSDRSMSFAEYVHSVFEQHQQDSHRSTIGPRYVDKLQSAGWSDDAVQKLSDEELNPYEFAIKAISKRIKDGRMDSIALVNLVGDKVKKIVQNDGRNFGPRGGSDADKKAAILKLIDEQTLALRAGQDQTEAQLNDKLGNFTFSVSDLKKALESDTLSKDERAFVFTIFSDVVGGDKALCKKMGITEERCQELRKECKTCFNTMLDNGVTVLADEIANHPGDIEVLKLTEKEKNLITTLAEHIANDNGKHAVDDPEVDREGLKSLETVMANAAMSKTFKVTEDGKEKSFVKAVGGPRKVSAVAKTEDESLPANDGGDDKVLAQASKKIGDGFDDVPLPSAAARELKKRAERDSKDPSEGVAV